MEDISRQCNKCGTVKILSDFYKSNSGKFGHQSRCKVCIKEIQKARWGDEDTQERIKRHQKTDANKERLKKYRKTEKYKLCQRRYLESDKGKKYKRAMAKKARESHPKKLAARTMVYHAIKCGYLPKPCDVNCHGECGNVADKYHHTHGYEIENWLKVVPVCNHCHLLAHGGSFRIESTITS